MQAAAKGGHTEIVSILLDKGANVNATEGFYGSSLQAAVQSSRSGYESESSSDSGSEESDVDMPDTKPQGNVNSSSEDSRKESAVGKESEGGEEVNNKSEKGSEDE
jgi:hypothetical protein